MSPTIEESILEQVVSAGFRVPTRGVTPELPADVTVIASSEVMRLMVGFTAMLGYARTEEALAKTRALSAASRYKVERGKQYVVLRQDSGYSETERQAILDCDERLIDIKKEEVREGSYAGLVGALREDMDSKYAVLSRELTRRGVNSERSFD